MSWTSWECYAAVVEPVAVERSGFDGYTRSGFIAAATFGFGHGLLERAIDQLASRTQDGSADDLRRLVKETNKPIELVLCGGPHLAEDRDVRRMMTLRKAQGEWIGSGLAELRTATERFVELLRKFSDAVVRIARDRGQKIEEDVANLPDELRKHFRSARSAMSIGECELAAFAALRGLESTLRLMFSKREIMLEYTRRGQTVRQPLSESGLHDMIEGGKKVRWRNTKNKLIDARTGGLLQFLRQVRNGSAHADADPSIAFEETAVVAAKKAGALWAEMKPRRQIDTNVVVKDWA